MVSSPEIPIPVDETAELMVLSSMILDADVVGDVLTIIREESVFTDDSHRQMFRILSDMYEANKPLDAGLIHAEIKRRKLEFTLNAAYIDGIISAAPSSAYGASYAALLVELATKRRLISAVSQSVADCWSHTGNAKELADRIEGRIFDASQVDISSPEQGLSSLLDDMIMAGDSAKNQGIPTGYLKLDEMLIGLHPGEMIVLAARPSVGKTALALNIAENIAVNLKLPVAFFSLEMRTNAILERLVSSRAGIDLQVIRRGKVTAEHGVQFASAVADLRDAPIYIDDTPSLTIMDLRAKARRLKKKRGIKLIILDYLQLMDAPGKSENRQQEIARISRGIKTLASELDVPVLCLSQLNRSSAIEERRPRSSDLRESGTIEQDADVVMLLHREDVAHRGNPEWNGIPNVAELIVDKQRNGPCGIVTLTVRPAVTRFENAAWN